MSDTELKDLVATQVMGWEINEDFGGGGLRMYETMPKMFRRAEQWNPLKDWNHTMQVVEKLVLGECERFHFRDYQVSCGWEVNFGDNPPIIDFNPQRAICIAALLATSSKDEH